MSVISDIKIRPLERGDLHFVHKINNNDVIMRYWFEEPYEAYDELVALYDRHLHDQNERRFIIEHDTGQPAGLVELVEIDYIHRRAEFQIINRAASSLVIVGQRQDGADLVLRHVQRAAVADQPQALQVGLAVAAVVVQAPFRGGQQPFLLVIPDGFDRGAGRRGQFADTHHASRTHLMDQRG